jgi:hypothetical protein
MKLDQLLKEKEATILGRWLNEILETYPADSKRFLKKQKDQFANPVGYTLSKELQKLYKEVFRPIDSERVAPILDAIVRIRAIQDFSASEAVAPIFFLKKVIREELQSEIQKNALHDALLVLESRIDELALAAFDIYMKCRERIYEIKVNETRNQVSRLLKKAGLISEVPDWSQNPPQGKMV